MKNATSIKYNNNNSSVDSIGNDKSFESENESSYSDFSTIKEKKRQFVYQSKNLDRKKKEISKDKKSSLWNALYHTVFNHKNAFKNNINIHDINLRFNLSIFKNEEEKKRAKNKKNDNDNTSYTQLKNFINLYSNTKKQNRSSINTNRPRSLKFSNSTRINDSSKSPDLKSKLKGAIATIKHFSNKLTNNQENNEIQSKKISSNVANNEKKELKLGFKSLNTINPDKISNEITGINYNNINTINQNQNSQNYKNANQEEFQNQNNPMNSQTKVLPINYRKNSVSILAGYEIKDIDSLMNFIEREKTSNKKVIDDEKEKENFNHIISNKYAYEVELEKYSNYIQKRANMKKFEHLIDFRKAENFFQLNRDMSLVDRYSNNIKDVQKYIERIEIIDTTVFEKLDFSKKFDLNQLN